MDIEIRHCNNIERARITLTANKLNIKFRQTVPAKARCHEPSAVRHGMMLRGCRCCYPSGCGEKIPVMPAPSSPGLTG